MKPVVLLAAAALATAVHAAPVTAPKPPAPPGPVFEAIMALAQEVSAATPPSMPVHQRLDALMQFKPSAQTGIKLARIYGGATPWTLVRQPGGAGAWNYRATLSPLHFKDSDGGDTDWASALLDIAVGADDRSYTASGVWPELVSTTPIMRTTARGMRMGSTQTRGADDLWFGATWMEIDTVQFEPKAAGARVGIEGIRIATDVLDQQAHLALTYQLGIRRLAMGADGIDNLKVAARVTGIDRQAMLDLQSFGQQRAQAQQSAARSSEAMRAFMKTMARGAIRAGTALEIDELSAAFHGQTVRASGRVFLEGALEADADTAQALLKKLAVKLSVKAPMALLLEVSKAMAEMQLRAKNQGNADPQAVAQLAASMNDIMLGKMVSSGLVRVDGDMLISDIDYSAARGGLRVNGKPVALPAMPAMAGAPAFATASPQLMQARRIDERCALPDYPADIIKADAPLSLTMRLLVKADGSVRKVVLATPSTHPDYDQAALAAAARCVYIPALRNGQPADAQVVWKVVREAGTSRP